jgi:hypothetical protein
VQEADERPVVLSAEEPITPELTLVDSDLAQRARARLPVPTDTIDLILRRRFVAALPDVAAVAIPPVATPPVPSVDGGAVAALRRLAEHDSDSYDRPVRRRGQGPRMSVALACAAAVGAAIFGVTVVGDHFAGHIDLRAESPVARLQDDGAAQGPSSSSEVAVDAQGGAVAAADVGPVRAEEGSLPAARSSGLSSPRRTTTGSRDLSTSHVSTRSQKTTWETRPFIWPARQGATSYHVELHRGESTILAVDSRTNRVVVPARWHFHGRKLSLDPDDRFSVWPVAHGVRDSTAIISGALVVDLP